VDKIGGKVKKRSLGDARKSGNLPPL